tara:strand:+ start:576 stop:704 length:129 start_codon:yes stop_codon:yes gene_type:complete
MSLSGSKQRDGLSGSKQHEKSTGIVIEIYWLRPENNFEQIEK